jgi:hypothetical protein
MLDILLPLILLLGILFLVLWALGAKRITAQAAKIRHLEHQDGVNRMMLARVAQLELQDRVREREVLHILNVLADSNVPTDERRTILAPPPRSATS